MKLKARTIRDLAQMVTGGSGSFFSIGSSTQTKWDPFPYRSSSQLNDFFIDCDLEHRHESSNSRVPWTQGVLDTLNEGPASQPQLPADAIIRVVTELMSTDHFPADRSKDRSTCLTLLNEAMEREGLLAYLESDGQCHLRAGQATSVALNIERRIWSLKDIARQKDWEAYLDTASEDTFTTLVLLPLLQQCGFQRISIAGHKDKALEYGKDIWMKFRLPTSHSLYFGVQVKRGTIDAAGRTKSSHENVAEVLNQAKMALAHPIWDPDINKRVLVDHVYVVASGEITKQAKQFLGEKLDIESRRQTIFMDRAEIVTLLVQTDMPLPLLAKEDIDDIPF